MAQLHIALIPLALALGCADPIEHHIAQLVKGQDAAEEVYPRPDSPRRRLGI